MLRFELTNFWKDRDTGIFSVVSYAECIFHLLLAISTMLALLFDKTCHYFARWTIHTECICQFLCLHTLWPGSSTNIVHQSHCASLPSKHHGFCTPSRSPNSSTALFLVGNWHCQISKGSEDPKSGVIEPDLHHPDRAWSMKVEPRFGYELNEKEWLHKSGVKYCQLPWS